MDGVFRDKSFRLEASLEDTSGAILVVGLFLGFALALAVQTLVGVGSAILDRETVQSAADAAAFESAVWHARGMNTLAGLNALIAIVLSTLVFWRLATFAAGLAVLLEAVSLVQQPSSTKAEIRELTPLAELLDDDAHMAGSVILAASGLRVAEAAVAAYTPVLAAHAAALHTKESFAVVARTFSASMLPSVQTNDIDTLAACLRAPATPSAGELRPVTASGTRSESSGLAVFRGRAEDDVRSLLAFAERGPKLESSSARLGAPFSLPVQVGSSALLCTRAAQFAGDAAAGSAHAQSVTNALNAGISARKRRALAELGVLSKEDRLVRLGEELAGMLDARAPAVFCAPAGQGVDALRGDIARLASDLRQFATDEHTRAMLARLVPGRGSAAGGPQSLADARATWQAWQRALEAGGDPGRCIRPAEVWSPARNGNGFFRSASSVEMPSPTSDARFVREAFERDFHATAHAEAFFDCDDSWSRCRSNALWQPSWSARLRRVRSFRALLDPDESTPTFTAVDANVMATWLDRLARRIGVSRVLPDVAADRAELELEPEPVARTWSFGLLQMLTPNSTDAGRPLAGFVARHASDSSIVH